MGLGCLLSLRLGHYPTHPPLDEPVHPCYRTSVLTTNTIPGPHTCRRRGRAVPLPTISALSSTIQGQFAAKTVTLTTASQLRKEYE